MAQSPSEPNDRRPSSAASQDVRERILDRTIFLMSKLGTTDVTVRAIAQEAGVNVSAVNYYFTSKERMMQLMADRFQSGFEIVMDLLEDPSCGPEDRLRHWAKTVMGFLAEYPGVLTLMGRQLSADPLDAFGLVLRSTMQSAIDKLRVALHEVLDDPDEERLSFKLTLFVSTLAGQYPSQLDRLPKGGGVRATIGRERFLDLLMEHLEL
jgi:AcrR family transcriptional regulator